jgi:hypothetical protein
MISLAPVLNVSYITILSFRLDISLLVVDLCVLTKISRSSGHTISNYQCCLSLCVRAAIS